MKSISVQTSSDTVAIDITDLIQTAVAEYQGLTVAEYQGLSGMLWVNTPHTTAALLLTESDDDFLVDLAAFARRWPNELGPYTHHKNDNPNAAAHLVSALGGTQLLVPLVAGAIVLGTYQRFVLLEMDGPKLRQVQLAVLADATPIGTP